jgi:hypothetical protein
VAHLIPAASACRLASAFSVVITSIADALTWPVALRQECALPPLSPVPGQPATLCARLNLSGHGITTPPARGLPEPWLSVLTH